MDAAQKINQDEFTKLYAKDYYSRKRHDMKTMDINIKKYVLNEIYKIYNRFSETLSVACEKYCSTCCTRNVTMTTIESYIIIDYLRTNNKVGRLTKVTDENDEKWFRPGVSVNDLANLCAQGKETPEEGEFSLDGNCPLLENNLCSIYPARPFACRCLFSKRSCRETGYADMESYELTVNNLFLQFIEHADSGGLSGNLIDLIQFMVQDSNFKAYENNVLSRKPKFLIANQPISALLIPPEHQEKIADILTALQNIKVPIKHT